MGDHLAIYFHGCLTCSPTRKHGKTVFKTTALERVLWGVYATVPISDWLRAAPQLGDVNSTVLLACQVLSRVAFSASEESPQGKNEGFQVRSLQEGTDKT